MYVLKIDDRENIDFELFDTECGKKIVDVKKQRLTVSDYAVYFGDLLLFIIERKTWDDLAASIKDNRLEEQVACMVELRIEKGVEILLLVEGVQRQQHGHIDAAALDAMLDTLMFNNRLPLIRTLNGKQSAQRIFQLIDNFPLTDVRTGALKAVQGGNAGDLLVIPRERSLEQMALMCMCAIKGVSMNTARVLIKQYTVESLMRITDDDIETLSSLTYPTGTLFGPVRSKKLVREVANPLTIVKILAEIPGITKATATKMLDLETLDQENISQMIKAGTRKVGPKVAEKTMSILQYFHQV